MFFFKFEKLSNKQEKKQTQQQVLRKTCHATNRPTEANFSSFIICSKEGHKNFVLTVDCWPQLEGPT